ncbi:MAG: FecR domain-containing protein [Rhizonema sp. PD37]|nr:FecR domain-containing protein [Rhizonema sp. PD37]
MFRKLPIIAVALWGVLLIPPPNRASATTALTKAEVQDLRNVVQLMPHNQPRRQAHKRDAMIPGDGLATGRASLADLRFNDRSLARVGQETIFRFLPKTRNFSLSSGTVLLLIPPGNGRTRVNTPSASAAIRGSALFVRYDEKTDTTVVGALTNSGIQVFNKDASQSQMLAAGQLMVIVQGRFQRFYNFDLRTFYNTSDLVEGLYLNQSGVTHPDPALAKVQAETLAALKVQSPLTSQHVIKNLDFSGQTSNTSNLPDNSITRDKPPVTNLQNIGEILLNRDNNRKPVGDGRTTIQTPPATTIQTLPATTIQTPPATTIQTPPATTIQTPPATTIQTPPATTIQTPPATTIQTPPATTIQTPPPPTVNPPHSDPRRST